MCVFFGFMLELEMDGACPATKKQLDWIRLVWQNLAQYTSHDPWIVEFKWAKKVGVSSWVPCCAELQ